MFSTAKDYPPAWDKPAESVAFNKQKWAAAGLHHNLASLRQLEAVLPGALVAHAGALGRRLVRALSTDH